MDYEALRPVIQLVELELSYSCNCRCNGLVLKGSRIVIPANLQGQVLKLAHEGHQGVNKTKSLRREKVWFSRIDATVAKLLDECIACSASYDPKSREPL